MLKDSDEIEYKLMYNEERTEVMLYVKSAVPLTDDEAIACYQCFFDDLIKGGGKLFDEDLGFMDKMMQ